MSARMGRPPKEVTKSVSLGLRISEETAQKLKVCAEAFNKSRTQIIEEGIDLVYESIKGEKK